MIAVTVKCRPFLGQVCEEAGLKRWIGAAAAGLTAVCGLVMPGTAMASSGAWYQVYQVNASGDFSGIAAISKTNIWAVGDLFDKKGNTIYQPFIRHYDGSGWKTVTIPGFPKFESDWVHASAANDVWVGGLGNSSVAYSIVYRFDGSHWHKVPVPAQTYLQGVAVLSPTNVWAFGSSATIFPPSGNFSADVFHWNGSKWQGYYLNFLPQSVSASSSGNVWMAGLTFTYPNQKVAAYRWNGSAWHSAVMPHPVPAAGPGVAAFSPSNVWIGWYSSTRSYALHWDGYHWHTLTVPDSVNADTLNIVPDGKGGYWFGYAAILTGNTWTSEPAIEVTGGFGSVVRIPGTESFLLPATVENSGSSVQKPTIYRFDL